MNEDRVLKVVCARGHREKLAGPPIRYRLEDGVIGPVPEDFTAGDRRRAEEPTVLRAGAQVPASALEPRPDGGSKLRLRCTVPCHRPLDVPLSWAKLNRGEALRKLREPGPRVVKIELGRLAAILSSS